MLFYPECVCRRSEWSRCWPAVGDTELIPGSDQQTGSSWGGLGSQLNYYWVEKWYLRSSTEHKYRPSFYAMIFYVSRSKSGGRIRTISRLSEQPVVWIDDLIRQDIKPLPNNTLTLKHRVKQNQYQNQKHKPLIIIVKIEENTNKKKNTFHLKIPFHNTQWHLKTKDSLKSADTILRML